MVCNSLGFSLILLETLSELAIDGILIAPDAAGACCDGSDWGLSTSKLYNQSATLNRLISHRFSSASAIIEGLARSACEPWGRQGKRSRQSRLHDS